MPDEPVPSGSQGSSPTGTNSSLSSADRFGLDANDTRKILVYEYRGGPVKTTSQQELCRTLDKGISVRPPNRDPQVANQLYRPQVTLLQAADTTRKVAAPDPPKRPLSRAPQRAGRIHRATECREQSCIHPHPETRILGSLARR